MAIPKMRTNVPKSGKKKKASDDPIKGLKNALRASQVASLSQAVARSRQLPIVGGGR